MAKLFGTDGVRGVANIAPMTVEMALEIGRAAAYVCKSHKNRRHRIVIGKDTRLSGYMFENALTAGICSMGVDVLLLGPMPTPGIAFITRSMRADAGLVISASHNPYQDNGIKIFSRDGFKLPDEEEARIEDLIVSGHIRDIRPTADEIGKARRIDDALGRYIVFCKDTFPESLSLSGLKLVLDCANGAAYKVAPIIFAELGADVVALHDQPDGLNINDRCGSQFTQDLRAKVLETGADAGLAFDGDADRLIAVDEQGRELSGEQVLAACAADLKARGELAGNLVITTVMASVGFLSAMRRLGIETGVAAVGDRNVLELMRQKGAVLGGESSGHTIFLRHHTTGDGIISALQLLRVMQDGGRRLSAVAAVMAPTPQVIENVSVARKPPLEDLTGLQAAIRAAEADLGDEGRVLVRYSGTQALCRVMVEAPSEARARELAEALAEAVRRDLGEA